MEIRCMVTGRVQRVGYRDYVVDAAMALGLFGSVVNNPDGSVTVVAQGEPEQLRQMVEYLHEGSALSQIDGVAVEWGTALMIKDDFSIIASV
jgi:acylphosphatase